ncbi:MAG: hypothetical protein CVU48_06605 [Candidatus Cloacimonetes bacterium HGW-Cloacimonetes-1]|nr:MAG: hypothetical protein CVU48_06605 [Candidatus Cloacimonetes bacterium HGW-Cloacimonetes-1]
MKIAITGANGFVGSNLVKHFQGCSVIALVRKNSDCSLLNDFHDTITVDYSNIESMKTVLCGVDVVIHNAGLTRAVDWQQMYRANVVTTSQIIQAVNQAPSISRFIQISSLAASHPAYRGEEVSESDRPLPLTWYGKSKMLAEKITRQSCEKPWSIVRPCSVYGEGERDFLQLFQMVKKGFILQAGKPDNRLNLIHVSELCTFIELVMNCPEAVGEIFNANDGEIYQQDQFIAVLKDILKPKHSLALRLPDSIVRLYARYGDIIGKLKHQPQLINSQKILELFGDPWLGSITKARETLKWDPKPQFEKHLSETIKWYETSGWL